MTQQIAGRQIRDYFVRAQGEEELVPFSADAPIRAAQAFSIANALEPDTVVEVKGGGGLRAYRVGPNPRVVATLGTRARVTVR